MPKINDKWNVERTGDNEFTVFERTERKARATTKHLEKGEIYEDAIETYHPTLFSAYRHIVQMEAAVPMELKESVAVIEKTNRILQGIS